MPGGSADLGAPWEDGDDEAAGDDFELDQDWMPPLVLKALTVIQDLLSSLHPPSNSRFEEQFKYDVISSNLLSASLPVPSSTRIHAYTSHENVPRVPGHLQSSRDTSIDESPFGAIDITDPPASCAQFRQAPITDVDSAFAVALSHHHLPHILVAVAAVLGVSRFYACAFIVSLCSLYFALDLRQALPNTSPRQGPATNALEVLHELINAGNVWDSAVNEAFGIVELDEKRHENSAYYSPASPSSPTSPLRISLQTTLHTTASQCDNIRQLLSALTCPTSLSQLSEMYAPPSPSASPMRQTFASSSSGRPTSFPERSLRMSRVLDAENEKEAKRATWNGSYTSLAFSGKDRRKEKRRSDLSSLLQAPGSGSTSAPATPMLAEVTEEDATEHDQDGDAGADAHPPSLDVKPEEEPDLSEEYFGKDALGLRRKRRIRGLNSVLGMSTPPSSAPSSPQSPRYQSDPRPRTISLKNESRTRTTSLTKRRSMANSSTSLSSGSRYTLLPASRHPLSLSSIQTSLHSAIAAKRYACAHLLALRFRDDDEAYWEDVRSVVGLLKSTFEDAAERLAEACERHAREGSMSPLGGHSRVVSLEEAPGKMRAREEKGRTAKVKEELLGAPSFAPMPSQLTRFAMHVDTISTALTDAREQLEETMLALRSPGHQVPREDEETANDAPEGPREAHPALQAYERLRRELGLALRECERGRERLLDILTPRRHAGEDTDGDLTDELPALGPDVGSDESDKHDSLTPIIDQGAAEFVAVVDPADEALDDATSHLLLGTSSQHLPPPGVEQVFESDAAERMPFTREKSKLSREERIRLMKERREKAGSLYLGPSNVDSLDSPPPSEKWGPGGDVVQELKDVIWQVGEKRRKVSEGHKASPSLQQETTLQSSAPGTPADEVRTLS